MYCLYLCLQSCNKEINLLVMGEHVPSLAINQLSDGFRRQGAEGIRSAIAFNRISFGVPLYDAVALDGGIDNHGKLDDERLEYYKWLEAKLMAHRGEAVAVVGAFRVSDRPAELIHAMSVSVGIINPEAEYVIKPHAHTMGAEIDTSDRHAAVWHYTDRSDPYKKVGIQWADLLPRSIPTVMANEMHHVGKTETTDNGNVVTTDVLVGDEITAWAEKLFGAVEYGSNMAYQMLASSVECLYRQYGAEVVKGLFMHYAPFASAARKEFDMVKDVHRLIEAYETGLTFGGEPLLPEESLLLRAGMNAVADRRVADLSDTHQDLLWRLPRTGHGSVLSKFGVPEAGSAQARLRVLTPHLQAFTALLSSADAGRV